MSKETLLLVCLFGASMCLACAVGGVVAALWTHDPWWLLLTLFGFLLYGWVR